ncbi:hypothetical protein [Mycobacterium riyadhense]|uniref:Uncharacterized protein n=1 Tax=Mycobacterium riyadhense TaxID=486698 RepID=A0A1X2D4F1_9MYCO|nr:hypothetical protein [Mycobacterium riyadhense]MCV7147409.1 hypothetical protein [Mycobacterium riyadhense]ORW83026.1 hypothetical protein AWC22_15520 [Mycobacterium riyadhense]
MNAIMLRSDAMSVATARKRLSKRGIVANAAAGHKHEGDVTGLRSTTGLATEASLCRIGKLEVAHAIINDFADNSPEMAVHHGKQVWPTARRLDDEIGPKQLPANLNCAERLCQSRGLR